MTGERAGPERGDIVWITLGPRGGDEQAGHEQAGRRPALVLSPSEYNEKTGLAVMCPVTTRVKGYPFEVALPHGGETSGVVLADQVRTLDWRAHRAAPQHRAPEAVVHEVQAKLSALLALPST